MNAGYKTIGSIVTFGHYEQDNNIDNSAEEIEWIVLDYDEANHRALLLSKYGLDAKPYNIEWADITWEECTLRVWLNMDFLQAAFSTEEQSAILTTDVDNSSVQGYSRYYTSGGNNTRDQIFLLSFAEANRYLGVTDDDSINTESRVAPTAYAVSQGAYISDIDLTADGEPAGWWWLRSPGFFQYTAADVLSDGSLNNCLADYGYGVARPAFWLDLDADIF